VATSPISSRLNLHQKWVNDLPLKNLWTVDFQSRSGSNTTDLGGNISRVISKYERRTRDNWPVVNGLLQNQTDSTGTYGYLLAQTIAFPSETFGVSTVGISDGSGSGGYINGYIGQQRNSYGSSNKIDVTFLETNIDSVDNFIKPWIIACSYRGLIEDGDTLEDIKCNIVVSLFTKDKASYNATRDENGVLAIPTRKFEPRKQITFYNAVPYSVEGDAISYGELSISDYTKTVAFAFSHYIVTTPPDWLKSS
jgi:hypothetical protein